MAPYDSCSYSHLHKCVVIHSLGSWDNCCQCGDARVGNVGTRGDPFHVEVAGIQKDLDQCRFLRAGGSGERVKWTAGRTSVLVFASVDSPDSPSARICTYARCICMLGVLAIRASTVSRADCGTTRADLPVWSCRYPLAEAS